MSAQLPVLEDIRVASPCTVSWESMSGGERARHCGKCDLDVFNLSGMTREEAQSLIAGKVGRLCVRFYRRHDGTVMTQDCPSAWQALQRRAAVGAAGCFSVAALLAVAVISLASTVFRRGWHDEKPMNSPRLDRFVTAVSGRQPEPDIIVGILVAPPPPTTTPVPVPTGTP